MVCHTTRSKPSIGMRVRSQGRSSAPSRSVTVVASASSTATRSRRCSHSSTTVTTAGSEMVTAEETAAGNRTSVSSASSVRCSAPTRCAIHTNTSSIFPSSSIATRPSALRRDGVGIRRPRCWATRIAPARPPEPVSVPPTRSTLPIEASPAIPREGARHSSRKGPARILLVQRSRKWARETGSDDRPRRRAKPYCSRPVMSNTTSPRSGKDTIDVMKANGVGHHLSGGAQLLRHARMGVGRPRHHAQEGRQRNLDALEAHVEAGKVVLVVNPTCSMMLRQEYPTHSSTSPIGKRGREAG